MTAVFFGLLFLLGCVSSGVEPNWERARGSSEQGESSAVELSPTQQFRVELRDRMSSQSRTEGSGAGVRMRGTPSGIAISGGVSGSQKSQLRSLHSTSFAVGRMGQALSLQHSSGGFELRLLELRGNRMRVAVVKGAESALDQGRSRTTALRTEMWVVVGRWASMGGVSEQGTHANRSSQFGVQTEIERRALEEDTFSDFELRVSPF